MLGKTTLCNYAECRCAESCVLFIVMLNVITLSVVMLNVVMLSVVAPDTTPSIYLFEFYGCNKGTMEKVWVEPQPT